MKKILLVEDETSVVSFIQKGLGENGFEVSVALTAAMALEMVKQHVFDVLILDIMLPDQNGLDLCKEIRSQQIQTPVLFLTALGTSENIAVGLNSGGDDYLVKPFKFIELHARINALIRRYSGSMDRTPEPKHIYEAGEIRVDDDAKIVTKAGEEIGLTATEYRLLLSLIQNKGKVMSRADLLESAWDINFNLGTNVVDVYINYLRKKLNDKSENKLIHTVVGMGYLIK